MRYLLLLLLIPSLLAFADIAPEDYGAIVATRNAEKEALLATSPFLSMRDELFGRYVHDPEAAPVAGDVVLDEDWAIVQPLTDNPVAAKMATMLNRFLNEVMGIEVPIITQSDNPSTYSGIIELEASRGGKAGVAESFTVRVAPGRITVAGIDTAGLRDGVVRLIDLFGFRMAPHLTPRDVTYTPRIPMRRSASVPGHDMTVLLGGNAVGVGGGEVYAFSTSEAIPELAVRRVPGSLEGLAAAAKAAADNGLHAHAHFGIRTKFPEDDPLFDVHPEIRGARTWSAGRACFPPS